MTTWETVWRGTLQRKEHTFVWQSETNEMRLWCNDLGSSVPVWERTADHRIPQDTEMARAFQMALASVSQIQSGFWSCDQPWRMRDNTRAWVIAEPGSVVMRAARQWTTIIASASILWVSDVDGPKTRRRNWTIKDGLEDRIPDVPALLASDLVWRRRQLGIKNAS